jgi:hypothetical protein
MVEASDESVNCQLRRLGLALLLPQIVVAKDQALRSTELESQQIS